MKGYKGFNKGLICRGKQYAQNAAEIEKTKAEAEASANRTVAASITDGLIRMKEAEAREKHGWITVQGADTVVTNGESN